MMRNIAANSQLVLLAAPIHAEIPGDGLVPAVVSLTCFRLCPSVGLRDGCVE